MRAHLRDLARRSAAIASRASGDKTSTLAALGAAACGMTAAVAVADEAEHGLGLPQYE